MSKSRLLFFAGLALVIATALSNIGFLATDDYTNAIDIMIPAQSQRPLTTIVTYTHNPPLPRILMAGLAQLFLKLGVEAPVTQLRWVLLCLGLFGFLITLRAGIGHFEEEKRKFIAQFLLTFYFVMPLLYSRTLVESIAMPFVVMASFFAVKYWNQGRHLDFYLTMAVIALGALIRYQLGLFFLPMAVLPILRKDYRVFIGAVPLAVILFLATGSLDLLFGETFHSSLRRYLAFNTEHAAELFGKMPFYVFILLFVALTVPPTLLKKFKGLSWQSEYKPLLPSILFFLVFVIAHTMSPHKEERFMIPVLPLFLILLTPLFVHLHYIEKKPVRIAYFHSVNLLLLLSACFIIPQYNIIGLSLFLDSHPQIRHVYYTNDTLNFFPSAYQRHPASVEKLNPSAKMHCDDSLAVRTDYKQELQTELTNMKKVGVFNPGWIEAVVIHTNPKKNLRRSAIELYVPEGCKS